MPKSAGGVSAHSTIVRRRQNPRTLASRHPSFQTRLTMAPTNIGPAPERHSFPAAYPRAADKVFRIASVRDAAKPGRTVRESSVLAKRAAGDARQTPSAPYESRRLSQAISGPRFRPSRREGGQPTANIGQVNKARTRAIAFCCSPGRECAALTRIWSSSLVRSSIIWRQEKQYPSRAFLLRNELRQTRHLHLLAACLGEQSKVPR